MEKSRADKIITGYYKKLYGFALSKMTDIDKAEELASRITLEVYSSLLKADEIANINGYIYRIACNVFARYIAERKESAHLAIDSVFLPDNVDYTKKLIDSEEAKNLRREIAYLSETQRKIVVMHYYDGMKLGEIAEKLSIPHGTVKWHLYEAKNSLKEGIEMKRTPGTLGINPVKFINMGHSGYTGNKGDTSDFLRNSLTQNIAYAAYYSPKTVNEIAEELGVSPIFIEDEVRTLEEYGFMDRLGGGKYRTNIYITEVTDETDRKKQLLNEEYAKILCEEYIPSVFEAVKKLDMSKIYIPDNDLNLLLWAAVILAVGKKSMDAEMWAELGKYSVKRKDGGDYAAYADVEPDFDLSRNNKYRFCGDMTRTNERYSTVAWQVDTYYDNRTGGWRDSLQSDFDSLYEHISGRIKKDDASLEKYQRLYEKGYLVKDGGKDKVAMIVTTYGGDELMNLIPDPDEKLSKKLEKYNKEYYELTKDCVADHMLPLHKATCRVKWTSGRMRMTVIGQLLESGLLTLPTEEQKSALSTVLFCDVLPE
ncbi:MAG: sigma-70 family RNA polymerase sigma factor [Clostridia bacterium]|nr:sigma-70 family RNA polymerase sigma factor [Clostridia bacterium]